jgi:hypothetical protein
MIRCFRLRDGPRFLAVLHKGFYLDERAARIGRFRPVEAATASLFFPDLIPVRTLTDDEGSRFLQLSHRRNGEEVRLLFGAPVPSSLDPVAMAAWEALFHALAEWAARSGTRRLIAEVGGDELRLAFLRQVGFRPLRRDPVWAGPAQVVEHAFRIPAGSEGFSRWALRRGPGGAWLEELQHTREDSLSALAGRIRKLGPRWQHPVYVRVRRETPEIVRVLRELGFQPAFSLWRMVRWIVIPVPALVPEGAEASVSAFPACPCQVYPWPSASIARK